MFRLVTAPPTHGRVYPCPQCQEIISVNAPSCRFCHVPVDVKVAEQLWADNQQIATAITRASMFGVSARFALLMTGVGLLTLNGRRGSLAETWVVCILLALSYGAQWLNHNESLGKDDADFLAAVAKVKTAMRIWVAALLVPVAVYLTLNGLPDWNTILKLFVVE